MLEFFRHHRGAFLIFLTVVIIISFSFYGSGPQARSGIASPSDRAYTIYGKDRTVAELQRHERLFQLTYSIGMFHFSSALLMASRNYETQDGALLDFSMNLLVLEKKMNELGIHPSEAEIEEGLRNLQIFQKDGKFDENQASLMEEALGMNGFRSADLLELVKYDIGLRKLKELVTKNYSASPFSAGKRYAAMYQTIKASTVALELDSFKKDAKVDDAEIQKIYDEKKDTFKTSEKRAAAWVFLAAPEGLDKIEDVAERNKKQAEYYNTVNAFTEAAHQPGAKLAKLAEDHNKLALEKAELFEEDNPPEALKDKAALVSAIFSLIQGERAISEPVKDEKGYYFAELAAIEEPKQQELAEVKDKIRDSLIEQKASEAMATAVNDTREALVAGLKEGKKLADLAKEKNLTVTEVPEFDANTPPPALPNAYQVAQEAEAAAPGTVSKPIPTATGVLLVIVNDKELRKREDGESMRQSVEASIASTEREQIFRAWFGRQKEAANVKLPQLRVG